MKEITRIRIAKTSYDIELPAKKELESYIESLTVYAEDDNVLEDIEIRITELLAERQVVADGVISTADVAALRETLGEPVDFVDDAELALGVEANAIEGQPKRKLYRDVDHAVLGGVLAGTARYFKINPVWTRLAFLILLLVSFGTAALVYIVCWIIIPAAISVTEKLQSRGEPVTLAAIRQQSEGDEGAVSTKDRIRSRRRFFGVLVGVFGIFGALAGAGLTAAGIVALNVAERQAHLASIDTFTWIGLVASGVLFTILMSLVAVAGFSGRVTRQTIVAGIVVIVLGLGSFVAGVSVMAHQSWQRQEEIQRSIKERAVTLPATFSETNDLTVDAAGLTVEYHVSQEARATLTATPEVKVQVEGEGQKANVTINEPENGYRPSAPNLVVYGPALSNITVTNGFVQYYGGVAPTVIGDVAEGSLQLYGQYESATLNLTKNGSIDAEGANIRDAVIAMKSGGRVDLGNVATLSVAQPTSCASDQVASLSVENITSRQLTYNGTEQPAQPRDEVCGAVEIGNDFDDDYMRGSRYQQ